jgi:Flp pilus assembly protein TadD
MTNLNSTPPGSPTASRLASSNWFRAEWFHCLLLGLLGFLVRLPALAGEPIWDDDYLIRTNALIKSPLLILEIFRHYLFHDTFSDAYRPVQNLSYLIDYLLWNNNFYGFHLTNLLCHVASGVLLYLLLRRLLPSLQIPPSAVQTTQVSSAIPAFFIALLWIVHPAHSAAVDYVSGRADSLAFLFAATAWLLYLRARLITHWVLQSLVLGLAWFSGLLAVCSRETGLVWILIFCVYTFVFDRSTTPRQRWAAAIGCAALLASYAFLRSLPGPAMLPEDSGDATPPALRIVLMFRALGDYARVLLFPYNLHMERTVYDPKAYQGESGRWHAIEHEYLSIAGLLVLAALVLLSLRTGRGQRLRALGTTWFFIAFLPISNLITLNATVAEHWLYLPSVGLLIFLIGCVLDLPIRFHRLAAAFGCLAAVVFGMCSFHRSSDWTSNETFAKRTIAAGGATPRLVLLLAQAHVSRGDNAGAEQLLRRAVELFPNYLPARNNLADALVRQGNEEEAETLFRHSSQTAGNDRKGYPSTWVAALNLSKLHHREQDDEGAIAVLEKARHDYPSTWELISQESELLRENDRIEPALGMVQDFAHNNWWHYRAWNAYGRLLAQKGDADAAAVALRHASWLDIHETTALNLIALIQMRQNRLEEACRTQRRAVARQPDEPKQYLLLSDILNKMGRTAEARSALAYVSKLREFAGDKTAQN